jgi:hypothetical protein
MEHAAGAQGSPYFAPEGIVHPTFNRIIKVRWKIRRLDTLTSPPDGRISVSGGAYGKCSMNKMASPVPALFRSALGGNIVAVEKVRSRCISPVH